MKLYLDLVKIQIIKMEAEYPVEIFNKLEDTDEVTIRVLYNAQFDRKKIQPVKGFQFPVHAKLELFIEDHDFKLVSYIAECQFLVKDETVDTESGELLAKEIAFLSYPYAREVVAEALIRLGMPTALPYSPPLPTLQID